MWSVINSLTSAGHLNAVVVKSTVPVGTGARIRQALNDAGLAHIAYASNPEFTAEGHTIEDFMRPERPAGHQDRLLPQELPRPARPRRRQRLPLPAADRRHRGRRAPAAPRCPAPQDGVWPAEEPHHRAARHDLQTRHRRHARSTLHHHRLPPAGRGRHRYVLGWVLATYALAGTALVLLFARLLRSTGHSSKAEPGGRQEPASV